MSHQARDAVWEHSKASGSALLVLLCLAEHGNESQGHKSWPGIERIARRTRLTERQVKRHLKALRASGELHVELQSGRSRTNEYWLILPGLPSSPHGYSKGLASATKSLASATKGLEGDIQGQTKVTSKAAKGDISATQTISESKKENQDLPLNPPEGEEVESDSDYWMKLLTEFKGIVMEHATPRDWKSLKKHVTLPPREHGKALMRYLRTEPPERHDASEEARLLRCRKQNLSSLIRHLPEVCANAVRYDKRVHPERYRPKPPPPPPILPAPPGWIEIAMDLYVKGDDDWVKRYGERNREYLERTSWEELVKDDRNEILKEYQRREDEKKERGSGRDSLVNWLALEKREAVRREFGSVDEISVSGTVSHGKEQAVAYASQFAEGDAPLRSAVFE